VRRERRSGTTRQAIAVALLLTAFSLSGLACGLLTHAVAGSLLASAGLPTATTGRATQVPPHTPTTAPATATAVATIVARAGFSLRAYASPSRVAPGEQLKIIASVVGPDGVTPLAGVQCILQAPTSTNNNPPPAPLLATWPPPQITDSAGQAAWTLTAPSVPPGVYGVEVIAYGREGYKFKWDPTVTVSD
jgi:hypothetical protein